MKIKKIHIILLLLLSISISISLTFIETLVTSEDLVVYDENKPTYNIGDLTRMPFFFEAPLLDKNAYNENKNKFIIDYINQSKIYQDSYPDSIFSNYIKLLDDKINKKESNIEIPDIELLQKATDIYYDNNKDRIDEFLNTINNDKTLFVHIRSGDKGNVDDLFINTLQTLESKYEKIVLLSGVHNSNSNINDGKNTLKDDLNKLLVNNKYMNNTNNPNTHLCFFRKCKNLLVHRGGFSQLGCILFNGDNLYYIHKLMKEHGNFNEIWNNHINTKNITYY
jgi:hypothetical protein